ncbi:hypothetical protein KP509_14G021500 [Ceratopteris richardii]|uniref:C2H2-type domain-containing protein n=1 Tax=Ceratopteris richardii TaxID=49495 RepID=A0A8T2TB69_CERRI|nr:hypothetical protein KP509_14G021500 [Ceratopteris richardii]
MSNSYSNSVYDELDGFPSSKVKKKRNLPGNPDPDAEVIALSPKSLLATNRFVCEICNKGFQRDQNLQLHRRGHNLPWRLKQKASHEVKKKVYVCPEPTCVHHDPARALGDLTGIKKHFSRKHGEKKWKCDKCSKRYAVQSDWKAHQKICGTREYRCDCGTLFSRRDSFITHRAFCDALAEENGRMSTRGRQPESHEVAQVPNNPYMTAMLGDKRVSSSPTTKLSRDIFQYSDISKTPLNDKGAYDLPFNGTTDFSQSGGSFQFNRGPKTSIEGMPRWVQGGMETEMAKSDRRPGLSLCLGMDPGSGPMYSFQDMMEKMSASESAMDFSSLNSLQKLPFQHGYNVHPHAPAPSADVMSLNPTLLSSSRQNSAQHDSTNGALGSSNYLTGLDGFGMSTRMLPHSTMQPSAPSRLASAGMPSMMGTGHEAQPVESYHRSTTSNSATALLQKAAQMGATASKPTVLQKFGMAEGFEGAAHEMHRQGVLIPNPTDFIGGDHGRFKTPWITPNTLMPQTSLPFTGSRGPESLAFSAPRWQPPPPPLTGSRGGQRRDHEGDSTPMVDFLGVEGSGAAAAMVSFFSK